MITGCGGRGYWQQRADVVVIGTGVAGLVAALAAFAVMIAGIVVLAVAEQEPAERAPRPAPT